MGLTVHERQAVTREAAQRYQRATKKQKRIMLDEFTALTGYHRTYASWLLWIASGSRIRRASGSGLQLCK